MRVVHHTQALADFPTQLETHFRFFTEASWNWAPASWDGIASEHLTAIQQLCHVRDIEIDGYQVRFRRTLEEENPFLPSIDTDALVHERDYASSDPYEVLKRFAVARMSTLAFLSTLSPHDWMRTAVFEGYGAVTMRSLVHYLCSHDQQHLAGLQWLLGRIASPRSAA